MCFENKDFIKLHQSTLRKIDIFNTIIQKLADGTLKTDSNLRNVYGLTPQGIREMISGNWALSLVCWGVTIILSGLIGFYISKILS